MKFTKIISVFLLLFFVLQLLPVKQVLRYFYVSTSMAEELQQTAEKSTNTVNFFGEDIDLIKNDLLFFAFSAPVNTCLLHGKILLYCTNIADIETPPPQLLGAFQIDTTLSVC